MLSYTRIEAFNKTKIYFKSKNISINVYSLSTHFTSFHTLINAIFIGIYDLGEKTRTILSIVTITQ